MPLPSWPTASFMLGIAAHGGSATRTLTSAPNITIHNCGGAQPEVSRSSNGDVTIMLDAAVGDSLINNALRGLSSSVESTLTNDLTDLATGAKTAGGAFTDMVNQIVKGIEQMIIKLTIVEPLMKGLQSAVSGGLNLSSLGFNPIAGVTGSAHGNLFAGGNVIPFARGGVVDGSTVAPMALFGEAGPEAIVPLKRGSDGNLGIAARGGNWGRQVAPAPNITIHNYSGAQPQVSRSSNGDVTITLQKMVDAAVGDSLINGAGRRALAGNYGVKPFTGR